MDLSRIELPEGLTLSETEAGFALALRPAFPMTEARCLAVVCALWVREAAGGNGKLFWPNRVEMEGEPVCAVTCRAAASGELIFSFAPTPALPVSAASFARDVASAAAQDLAAYPSNRPSLMDRYCMTCETVKKFVDVVYRGMPLYGFAFAVDKHGGLMVMTQESRTIVTIYGGQARIVPKEDEPENAPEMPSMPHI